jgi:hypothetical protein
VRQSILLWVLSACFFSTSVQAQLQVKVEGNTIWVLVGDALNPNQYQCCRGANVDEPPGPNCSRPCGYASWKEFPCNWVGDHMVYANWSDETTDGYVHDQAPVTVSVSPDPVKCAELQILGFFDRVLTRRFGDGLTYEDRYPFPQTKDAQVSFQLRSWTIEPGTTAYVRAMDPADGAAYGGPHAKGDNVDPSGGTISLVGAETGSPILAVIVPTNGRLDLALHTSKYAAGDNYLVEASTDSRMLTDPEFLCTGKCARSSYVATSWKRTYLELDRMAKSGAYITEDIPPGSSKISVTTTSGFKVGTPIRIMHAPPLSSNTRDFYFEDRKVTKVSSKLRTIDLDTPLEKAYTGPEVIDGLARTFLADAVINPDAGYWDVPLDQIQPAWNGAFTEVVLTSDDPVPFLPHQPTIKGEAHSVSSEANLFARKWSYHRSDPNHMQLLTAWNSDYKSPGRASSITGVAFAWVFIGTSNGLAPAASEDKLKGEVVVHELTHLWQADHCAEFEFDSGRRCTMRDGADWTSCSDTNDTTCPEFFDGVSRFHHVSENDSEYWQIRKRPDPFPLVPFDNQ